MNTKNTRSISLDKLNPNYLLAHNKQSFRFFLIKRLQEAFLFANILSFDTSFNINILFLPKYLLLKEITHFNFLRTLTYGFHVYIPAFLISIDEQGNETKHLEWFSCGLLPGMTKNSSFIIGGVTRSIFTQLIRKQGLYFHKLKTQTEKDFLDTIMELRIKKLGINYSQFLFHRFSNNLENKLNEECIYIVFNKYGIQIPIILFLKALNISTDVLKGIFSSQKLDLNLFTYLPSTAFEARYLLFKLLLFDLFQEVEDIESKKNLQELIFLLNDPEKLIREPKFVLIINNFFFGLFWNTQLRDCDKELRMQLSRQCGCPLSLDIGKLQALDLVYIIRRLYSHEYTHIDVDHLTNKEIRTCGDFLYLHTIQGLFNFLKTVEYEEFKIKIKNNQSKKKIFVLPLNQLIRFRLTNNLSLEWKAFFISGTLSQYGQNLNPLSLLTHSRRITSLGYQGISLEQATVDIRNIHTTSFGHFCPIETPEGPNVGLIHSYALFTWCQKKSNTLREKLSISQTTGNLEYNSIFKEFATPFFYIYKNQVQKEHPLLITLKGQEVNFRTNTSIAADINHNKWFYLLHYHIGSYSYIPNLSTNWSFENELTQDINLQYISPYQMISAITGLIPFVEHNDANRALMGSNMQRQAVNLLNPSRSKVNTGLEIRTLSDINHNIYSPKTGYLANISRYGFTIYTKTLKKSHIFLNPHKKTNEFTYSFGQFSMNKRNWVQKGDFCGDFGSSKKGKLALGQNLFVGYLPWYGWNYEDAIILNEKCLHLFTGLQYTNIEFDPIFYSDISLDKKKKRKYLRRQGMYFEIPIHPFKLFMFFQKYNLSNLGDFSFLKKISYIFSNNMKLLYPGIWINKGDCLYGKCLVFLSFTRPLFAQYNDLLEILEEIFPTFQDFEEYAKIYLLFFKGYELKLKRKKKIIYLKNLKNKKEISKINKNSFQIKRELLQKYYRVKDTSIYATKEQEGFLLSIEVKKDYLVLEEGSLLNRVNLEIIQKKKLEIGDKLSGRHGNKGILSKICAKETMPYLIDGKPLDIVLNPLGIPSRMNLGQLYECFLGLAGYFLNESYIVSVFDEKFGLGASKSLAFSKLFESSLKRENDWLFLPNTPGKTYLFDGTTGNSFQHPISIGYTTILKLIHMVDKKLYARTQGAYSSISHQPVRGRSREGGQRLGEMEIWALQGYGAAFTLLEIYSLKSGQFFNRKVVDSLFRGLSANNQRDLGSIESLLEIEYEDFSLLAVELKALLFKI
uniref:RNA polymerase subunit beta n=1 Tax=Prototheca tumulicola TaxID=1737639 RepID=UPI003003802F